MTTSYESEFPERDPMTVDPASLGSVDPLSVEGLFLVALSKTGAERDAFLNTQCVDLSQRRRVESLLIAYEQAGDFLQKPAVAQEPIPIAKYLAPCKLPGTIGRLGSYEILEEIGRGGMGVVFRAHDPKLQRIVAVKALAPELARLPSARQRFLREARAAAAISHPHVVTIFAVEGTEEVSPGTERTTLPFLVMECVVGQTLHDKIKRVGALKVEEIVRISRQMAEGLAAAHKRGLIHRDIKPANILLENGVERVKITDFGLARTTSDGGITHTGEILGTPQCMSPEQARGEIVDQRSDLFSLGCVMYTMCTGISPFRADNMLAVMKKVCEETPRPVAQMNPNIPEWLCELVYQLLAKEPERRVQTACDVVHVLETQSSGFGITSAQPSPESGSLKQSRIASHAPALSQSVQWQHWPPVVLLVSGLIGFLAGQNRYSYMMMLPVWSAMAWTVLSWLNVGLKINWSWIHWRSAMGSVIVIFAGACLRVWLLGGIPRSNTMTSAESFLRENSGVFVLPLAAGIFWLLTRLMPWGFIEHRPARNQATAVSSRSPWSVLGWMLVVFLGIGLFGGLILAVAVIIPAYQAMQATPMELSRVVLETHGHEIAKVTVDGQEVRSLETEADAGGRPSFLSHAGPHTLHIEYVSDNSREEKFYHSTVIVSGGTTVIDAAPAIRPVGSGSTGQMQPLAASNPTSEEIIAKLQGEWLVTDAFHYVQGGIVPFDDEFELHTRPGSKRSFVIRNDEIWHRVEFDRKDTGEPYRMDIPWGHIVLREDESSQAIDLMNENEDPPETRGLFNIDGDSLLQLAIAVDSETNITKGMPRPKALLPGKDVIYFGCERTSLSEALVPEEQAQKWRSGIVELFAEWNDENMGTQQKPIGFGTVVSGEWVIGQVERIGPGSRKYIARCDDGSLVPLELTENDVNGGWYVFRPQSSTQFNHAFPIAQAEPELGDAVWAYAKNSSLSLITATVTAKDRRVVASGLSVWQLDRRTNPAVYSETQYGSLPVLNGNGELLGLSMAGTGELSLALPVAQFKVVFPKTLAQPLAAEPQHPVLAKLQGAWDMHMQAADPNPPGGKEEAVIEKDLMTITNTLDGKSVSFSVQLKPGTAGSPQQIDLIHSPNDNKDRTELQGIIEFGDDTVRIGMANSPSGKRPEVFAVGEDADIWELRRKPALNPVSELDSQ